MFKLLKAIIGFFSIYTDPFEKRVDKFFKKLSPHTKKSTAKERLKELMQQDMVRLNLFLERRFKGYKKTKKSYRRKLYENAEELKKDFLSYFEKNHQSLKRSLGLKSIPVDEKLVYVWGIMHYLRPGLHFEYREGSAFEKLLRNPKTSKLVGDCNQIVTLYIYLYALRFHIADFKIKLLREHVCLHFNGIDIEATSGRFHHYKKYAYLSGVEEIIAANLLDIPDEAEKKYKINPENLLKAAEIAYLFSSHREIVEKNLVIAYRNLTSSYIKNKQFKSAEQMAQKSGNQDLKNRVIRAHAIYLLKQKKFSSSRDQFNRIYDEHGIRACNQNELHELSQKIKNCKTVADFRAHKSKLKRMLELSRKLNHTKIAKFCEDVLKKI